MKRFVFAILIIISLICTLTNCSAPIGSIESPNTRYRVDAMWLVPRRQLYQIDDKFMRDEDFQLFIVDKGGVVEVLPPFTPDKIPVTLTGNYKLTNEFTELMDTTHHSLHQIGRHVVTVKYADATAWYSIEVMSSNNGNSLGGDDGIGIIWLE